MGSCQAYGSLWVQITCMLVGKETFTLILFLCNSHECIDVVSRLGVFLSPTLDWDATRESKTNLLRSTQINYDNETLG